MDILMMFETWFIVALVLSLAEIVIPGGILINLGIASILVAFGVKFAILDTWVMTLTAWFIIATFLLFVLNFFTNKWFGSAQTIENTDEDLAIFGEQALVVETIGPGQNKGRVAFHGTTWSALGDGTKIEQGSSVKIICKDNISLVVERSV
jgi:inner membrane protein